MENNFFKALAQVGAFSTYSIRNKWARRPSYAVQIIAVFRRASMLHSWSNEQIQDFVQEWALDCGGRGPQHRT